MKIVISRDGEEEVYDDVVSIKELTIAPEGQKRYFFWRYKAKEEDYIAVNAEDVKSVEVAEGFIMTSDKIVHGRVIGIPHKSKHITMSE